LSSSAWTKAMEAVWLIINKKDERTMNPIDRIDTPSDTTGRSSEYLYAVFNVGTLMAVI